MMNNIIFAVDDEADILEILEINLQKNGYQVHTFTSADLAKNALGNITPSLILLDIMMTGTDGYTFCRWLRSEEKYKNIPVIFLSAKNEEFDRVLGLELGGDDFVSKPFSVKELISRVKAVLRRTNHADGTKENDNQKEKIVYKGIELFPERYTVTVDGEEINLTKSEFQILYMFLKYPGKIFSRDNIIDSIRGDDVYVIDRTIDVHIMNIRKKLGPYKNVIKTFSGIGYGFKEIN